MNNECTHHILQREGPWVAPGSSPGVGGCTRQNGHQPLIRAQTILQLPLSSQNFSFTLYDRSFLRLAIVMIAATAAIPASAGATDSSQILNGSMMAATWGDMGELLYYYFQYLLAGCFLSTFLGLIAFWFIKPWFVKREDRLIEPQRSRFVPIVRETRGTAFRVGLSRQQQLEIISTAFASAIAVQLDDWPYELEDVLDASNADALRYELLRHLTAGSSVGVGACCALLWHSCHGAFPEAKPWH